MKFIMCLFATLATTAALAGDLTYETIGNCVGLVKTTDASGTVTYSHSHKMNIELRQCNEISITVARLGANTTETKDLVEVYVRFDNPKVGETLSYLKYTGTSEFGEERVVLAGEISSEEYTNAISEWIEQMPLDKP
jgi:hypothetical protein